MLSFSYCFQVQYSCGKIHESCREAVRGSPLWVQIQDVRLVRASWAYQSRQWRQYKHRKLSKFDRRKWYGIFIREHTVRELLAFPWLTPCFLFTGSPSDSSVISVEEDGNKLEWEEQPSPPSPLTPLTPQRPPPAFFHLMTDRQIRRFVQLEGNPVSTSSSPSHSPPKM